MQTIVILSVSFFFLIFSKKNISFAVSAAIFVSGLFVLGIFSSPSEILSLKAYSLRLSYESLFYYVLVGVLLSGISFLPLIYADAVGSSLSSFLFTREKVPNIKKCCFYIGCTLFLSLGGISELWKLSSSNIIKTHSSNILFEVVIPLGSVLFISLLASFISIFVVSLGFDFLVISFRRIVDFNLRLSSYKSLRVCVLILFVSSTLYVFSSELSEIININRKFLLRN